MKHFARLILSCIIACILFAIAHTIIADGVSVADDTATEATVTEAADSTVIESAIVYTETIAATETVAVETEPVLSKEEQAYANYLEFYPEEIEEDIWYLTCFLYGECRGSNQTLQSCCAWAILNYTGKGCPGNIHRVVKYYSDGSYWSNYITSFGNYNWMREWTADTGKKIGKVFHLNSKLQTVEEKNPKIWNRCKDYATDVYHRWLKELSGYSEEEVGRTLPTGYIHFWADRKAKTGTVFPKNWATRHDHSGDFVIDYENSPYNTK